MPLDTTGQVVSRRPEPSGIWPSHNQIININVYTIAFIKFRREQMFLRVSDVSRNVENWGAAEQSVQAPSSSTEQKIPRPIGGGRPPPPHQ